MNSKQYCAVLAAHSIISELYEMQLIMPNQNSTQCPTQHNDTTDIQATVQRVVHVLTAVMSNESLTETLT